MISNGLVARGLNSIESSNGLVPKAEIKSVISNGLVPRGLNSMESSNGLVPKLK